MLDERLNKVIRRVVRPGSGPFVALSKGELEPIADALKDRLVLQQPLVN